MLAAANRARTSFASPPSIGMRRTDHAVIGERFEGDLRNGVHGEWCGQSFNVKDIRSLRILGAGAGPQQALRTGAGIVGAHPSR